MMTNKTAKQKKDVIFAVIAELEANGKRINADLVARTANMGKQTILPYYNEWRFLQKMGQYQQEDVPEELLIAIKQQMGKWKYEYETKHLDYEDSLKQDINNIEDKLDKSYADNNKLQHALEQQDLINDQHLDHINELNNKINQLEKLVFELQTKLSTEKKQISKLEDEAIKLQKQQQLQTDKLELKLENQYQSQIDHWIKTTDYEKNERNKLEKKLTGKQDEIEQLRAKNLQLNNKESKLKSLLNDTNAVAIEHDKLITTQKDKLVNLEKISVLLDCPIDKLPNNIRKFIKYETEVNHYKDYNQKLLQQIDKLHKQMQQQVKKINYKFKKQQAVVHED